MNDQLIRCVMYRKHLFCEDDGVLPRGTSQAKHGVEIRRVCDVIQATGS